MVEPDLLLTRMEVEEAWNLSPWQLATWVKKHPTMRARRPGYQPYYPLSAVKAILGDPVHPPTPRQDRESEYVPLAA